MIQIDCPYSEMDMAMAALKFPEVSNKKQKLACEIISEHLQKLNHKGVAESVGISPLDLANSPNYDKIISLESKKIIHRMVEKLVDKVGFEDRQAWLVISAMTNPSGYGLDGQRGIEDEQPERAENPEE